MQSSAVPCSRYPLCFIVYLLFAVQEERGNVPWIQLKLALIADAFAVSFKFF